MTSFSEIKHAVSTTIDDDRRDVCLQLVDEIEKHSAFKEKLWTYSVFSSWVSAPEDVVQECVNFLASANKARLLHIHFLAFNPSDPEDIGTSIDDSEVAAAYRSGFLYHPHTGLKVKNFEEWLVPYFALDKKIERSVR